MISGLGHVGIICDDFMKMRDFYTRVIGLTVTDEDPERGSCFLSADPEHEHHECAAESEAHKRALAVVSIRSGYATHGRRAPLVRNGDIVAACDRLVAF